MSQINLPNLHEKGSSEPWFRAIARVYPMLDGRPDFSNIPGAIERTRSASCNSEAFLSFIDEMFLHFKLTQKVIYLTDTPPDIAFEIDLIDNCETVKSLSRLPQNHYVCCPDLNWCIFFGLGGSMGFAQNPNSTQRRADPPFPPMTRIPWQDIFRMNAEYQRLFPGDGPDASHFVVKQLSLTYGLEWLSIDFHGIPQCSGHHLKRIKPQYVILHVRTSNPRISIKCHPDNNPLDPIVFKAGNTYHIHSASNPSALRVIAEAVYINNVELTTTMPSYMRNKDFHPKHQLVRLLRQVAFTDLIQSYLPCEEQWYKAFSCYNKLDKYFKDIPPLEAWSLESLRYVPQKKVIRIELNIKEPDSSRLISMVLSFEGVQYFHLERYYYAPHNRIETHRHSSFKSLQINEKHLSLRIISTEATIVSVSLPGLVFRYAPPEPDII
jgi:hypothetical protein